MSRLLALALAIMHASRGGRYLANSSDELRSKPLSPREVEMDISGIIKMHPSLPRAEYCRLHLKKTPGNCNWQWKVSVAVPRYLPMAMIRIGRQERERHCHADVWRW